MKNWLSRFLTPKNQNSGTSSAPSAPQELLNFGDRPYSFDDDKDEYFAFGETQFSVLAHEPGLSTADADGPRVEHVHLERVIDLTEPKTLAQFKITRDELIHKSKNCVQLAIGDAARRRGFQALIVPTPRVKDGKVLVLFK